MSARKPCPPLGGFVVIPKLNQAGRVNGDRSRRRAVGQVDSGKRIFVIRISVRRVRGQ